MPLDMEPHFIVVHGVQVSTDDDIQSDKQIESLLAKCLGVNREEEYRVIAVKYEDINDDAQLPAQWLLNILNSGTPLTGAISKTLLDLVGDVFTASIGTNTANKIRAKIKKRILKSYRAGHPVYLIAHSLGTVYCLDVICELMQEEDFYNKNSYHCWPVQSFISMGSPLGITDIFKARHIPAMRHPINFPFDWHNFHHPLDPIVSGSILGKQLEFNGANGPVENCYRVPAQQANWRLSPYVVAQNKQWLAAHFSYWKDPLIGNLLINIAWG